MDLAGASLILFTIFVLLIYFVCITKAAMLFFQLKNKKTGLLLCFAVIFFIMALIQMDNYLLWSVTKQLLTIVFLCMVFQGRKWEKLGLSCVLVSVWEFLWNAICSIMDISSILLSNSNFIIRERVNGFVIAMIAYLITAFLVYMLFHKTELSKGRFLHGGEKILFFTMVVLLFLLDLCNYGISRGVTMVSNANGSKYWNTTHNELFTHIEVVILSVLCLSLCLFLLFGINRLIDYIAMDSIYKAEINHYQTMLVQYKNQVNVRHDMKNHLISMAALAENEEWSKLKKYLLRICDNDAIGTEEAETGNSIVDAIVNINRQTAESRNIKFDCEINIPKPLSIDDYDLCVIWGNILDNAITAANEAEEDKFVHIQAEIVKRNLIINVKNRMKHNALPKKFEVQNFGTGLMNVRKIVQRKDGVMNIEIDGNVFELSIMIPIVVQTEYDIK